MGGRGMWWSCMCAAYRLTGRPPVEISTVRLVSLLSVYILIHFLQARSRAAKRVQGSNPLTRARALAGAIVSKIKYLQYFSCREGLKAVSRSVYNDGEKHARK